MIKRLAKEVIYVAKGIDENRWNESSILEKVGDVVMTILLIAYTIVLPALIIVGLWLES